jgi:hypothetical protein
MVVVPESFDCRAAGAAVVEETVGPVADGDGELPVAEPPEFPPKGSSHQSRTRAPASEVPERPSRTGRAGLRRRGAPTGAVTGCGVAGPGPGWTGGGPNAAGAAKGAPMAEGTVVGAGGPYGVNVADEAAAPGYAVVGEADADGGVSG